MIVFAFSLLGVHVADGEVTKLVANISELISFGVLVWNQLGRSDVVGFIFKKLDWLD